MEMKDLVNECEALIKENQKKKETMENLQNELCDRCLENYRTLFVQEFVSLRKLTRRLIQVVPSAIVNWNVTDFSGKSFGNININSDFATFHAFGWNEFYQELNEVRTARKSADSLAEMFSTPGRTLLTLDNFKAAFARILKTLARCVRDENDELGRTAEKLASMLDESSFVKEIDDGSIEIRINGKTYIGTIKEA